MQKPSLYIASGIANWERVRRLYAEFERRGIYAGFNWTFIAEQIQTNPDYVQDGVALHEAAFNEYLGVVSSDHLLMVQPGGYGTHIELGVMLGKHWEASAQELPITILNDKSTTVTRPVSFYNIIGITTLVDEEQAIEHVCSRIKK